MQDAVLLERKPGLRMPRPAAAVAAARRTLRKAAGAYAAAGANTLKLLSRSARRLGPYVLVEILLPGGTVLALLLWLSQHARLQPGSAPWRVPERAAPVALIDCTR